MGDSPGKGDGQKAHSDGKGNTADILPTGRYPLKSAIAKYNPWKHQPALRSTITGTAQSTSAD